jgi:antirestriction protein
MCLLSYKLNNQHVDEVMELDHRAMYRKCAEQDLKEFYQFPAWIAKEVNKLRFKKVYHENKMKQERKQRLYDQLETINGIKHVRAVKILDNYFDYGLQ